MIIFLLCILLGVLFAFFYNPTKIYEPSGRDIIEAISRTARKEQAGSRMERK